MKILLTEDDLMLADCLEEAFAELGHIVCGVAHNVSDAVGLARLHRPDVAILDMQLDGRELGTDVVEQLVASGELGNTGVLYVTGMPERVHREARFGHASLAKPYSLTTLSTAVVIVQKIATENSLSYTLPYGLTLLHKARMNTFRATRQVSPGTAVNRNGRESAQVA